METDRQEQVESPLVEDFLDCDKLGAESDTDNSSAGSVSPRKTLKRLHIDVDMTTTQYLTRAAHNSDQGSVDGCSTGPSSVSYSSSGLDPYSAVSGVSSFNYPAAADSTLLTPVSSAGSPPLQNRPPTKSMRSFNSSQACPVSRSSAQTRYYSSYDVNTSSQGSSPMTVHPAATEAGSFDMTGYMAHTPPGSGNQPSSPKNDMPPIDPYLGHFTVSGAPDGEVTHHSFHDYPHAFAVDVAPPGAFLGQQQVPVGTPHMHHRVPSDGHAPVLAQPHPSQFRMQTTPRVGGIEDLRDPSVLLNGYPSHAVLSPGRRPQPRKKPSPSRKASRTPKATPHIGSEGQTNGNLPEDDGEELTLAENAPEDDKYLFQLRKEFLSEKGKGMWEEMKAKYSEKHQGNWEKAALQMKVSRAVAKFGVWPEKEKQRLQEAFQYYEEKRYQLIIARMKENGGCRVWDWKPQHIEAMLIKMGLEEPTIDEKTGIRRRKNKLARRRASPHNGGPQHLADWSNGLGLHHPFQGHAQQVAGTGRQGPYDMMPDDASIAPTFTSEQENEYLDQIFNKQVKTEPEGSLSPENMELTYDEEASKASGGRELNQQRSERVARQACEQLMQQQAQPYATQ